MKPKITITADGPQGVQVCRASTTVGGKYEVNDYLNLPRAELPALIAKLQRFAKAAQAQADADEAWDRMSKAHGGRLTNNEAGQLLDALGAAQAALCYLMPMADYAERSATLALRQEDVAAAKAEAQLTGVGFLPGAALVPLEFVQCDRYGNWQCRCGNHAEADGFHPCTLDGEVIDPDDAWEGLMRCGRCDRVFALDGRVVGKAEEDAPVQPPHLR